MNRPHMAMIFTITKPVFKCSDDENIFFERIYALNGYESVIGEGSALYLTVCDSSTKEATAEIQDICKIWNTTFQTG